MKVWTQVISLDTADSSPAVLIATDTSRYIVNAGEGLQRQCAEYRTKLVKVDAIFLTELKQHTLGGLPGVVLTVGDAGKKQMRVFGGPGLVDYIFATRHFLRRSDIVLEAREFPCRAVPPIALLDLVAQPVVAVAPDDADPAAVAGLEAGLSRLYTTNAAFRPFSGVPVHEVLEGGVAARAAIDGETPSARMFPDGWGPGNGAGVLVGSSRAARDAAHRELMQGCPLPLPFNPLLAILHGGGGRGGAPRTAQGEGVHAGGADAVCIPHSEALPTVLDLSAPHAFAPSATSYVFTTPLVGGRFLPHKARAAGLKPGPLYGQLSRGEAVEVTVKDAAGVETVTTVRPEDVKEPDQPGEHFAVVACPHVAFLPSLAGNAVWHAYTAGQEKHLAVMYHTCPPEVAGAAPFCTWLASFGTQCQHIMLHPRAAPALVHALQAQGVKASLAPQGEAGQPVDASILDPLTFLGQAQQACRMHVLEPSLFPVPYGVVGSGGLRQPHSERGRGAPLTPLQVTARALLLDEPRLAALSAAWTTKTGGPPESRPGGPASSKGVGQPLTDTIHVAPGRTMAAFHVLPRTCAGMDLCVAVQPWSAEEAIVPALVDPLVRPSLEQALGLAQDGGGSSGKEEGVAVDAVQPPVLPPALHPDAMLVFTGTASATPTKTRNVSGMYLLLPPRAGRAGSSQDACTVDVDGRHAIILDCGEGTYGQLARLFGKGQGPAVHGPVPHIRHIDEGMARVAVIWVSHMHADHHLGALRLVGERKAARQRLCLPPVPVLVVGPSKLAVWLLEAARVDDSIRGAGSWVFADAEHFQHQVRKDAKIDLHIPAPPVCARAMEDVVVAPMEEEEEEGGDAGDAAASDAEGGDSADQGSAGSDSTLRSEPAAKRARAEDSGAPGAPVQVWRPTPGSGASSGKAGVSGVSVLLPPVVVPWGVLSVSTTGGEPVVDGPSSGHLAPQAFVQGVFERMGVSALRTITVQHCFKAYGLRVEVVSEGEEGSGAGVWPWSVLYSGDTRPCRQLVALGMGSQGVLFRGPRHFLHGVEVVGVQPASVVADAGGDGTRGGGAAMMEVLPEEGAAGGGEGGDAGLSAWAQGVTDPALLSSVAFAAASPCGLLVHEATFDDTDEGRVNAWEKRHSTVSEALAVAGAARIRNTILTHFSARYPKLPVLKAPTPAQGGGGASGMGSATRPDPPPSTSEASGGVSVAYDLCTVHGRDLPRLHAMLPALHALFNEAESDEED